MLRGGMSDTDRSSQSPTFNETDVALIEGLRSGAGDAEIASRIGESQEWVRERVTFLAAQFGVQGRPGLAAWEPASVVSPK